MGTQLSLLHTEPAGPKGFRYEADFLTPTEEKLLLENFATLAFEQFQFQGYEGKRRVISFGWQYDFNLQTLRETDPIPDFLLPVREKAETVCKLPPDSFRHALITEYAAGAGIGWHKDKARLWSSVRHIARESLHLPPAKTVGHLMGEILCHGRRQIRVPS